MQPSASPSGATPIDVDGSDSSGGDAGAPPNGIEGSVPSAGDAGTASAGDAGAPPTGVEDSGTTLAVQSAALTSDRVNDSGPDDAELPAMS